MVIINALHPRLRRHQQGALTAHHSREAQRCRSCVQLLIAELTKLHVVQPSEVSFTRLIMNHFRSKTEQTCLELLSTMEEKLRFCE
ncbi:unnamed protein product [Boreogadus saida]